MIPKHFENKNTARSLLLREFPFFGETKNIENKRSWVIAIKHRIS
jgi:hypothetical protein